MTVKSQYNNKSEDQYINDKEVARLLGVCHRTVIAWRQAGKLPYYRIGRSIRYRRHDLERALDEHHAKGLSL